MAEQFHLAADGLGGENDLRRVLEGQGAVNVVVCDRGQCADIGGGGSRLL
jgi:hypothetical protein